MFWWRNYFDQSNLPSDAISIFIKPTFEQIWATKIFFEIEDTNDDVIVPVSVLVSNFPVSFSKPNSRTVSVSEKLCGLSLGLGRVSLDYN